MKYPKHECDAQIVMDFLSGFTDNYVMRVNEELLTVRPIV
jgi:dGTP triphosphohydrolase